VTLKTGVKFSFDYRNKLHFKTYSNRKKLFCIVLILFHNVSKFLQHFDQFNAALVSIRDLF